MVGQQGHLTGVLDRRRDLTLAFLIQAGHPTRTNLAPIGHKLAEQGDVFGVDKVALAEFENDALPPTTVVFGTTPPRRTSGLRHRCSPLEAVSYTHLRAHETKANLVCRLLL